MPTMIELKTWLEEQRLTVRELAVELWVPLKTAQDWAYRGVAPSAVNQASLTGYIMLHCAHHWVIAAPDGATSEGVCRRCGHHKEFLNSVEYESPWRTARAA